MRTDTKGFVIAASIMGAVIVLGCALLSVPRPVQPSPEQQTTYSSSTMPKGVDPIGELIAHSK